MLSSYSQGGVAGDLIPGQAEADSAALQVCEHPGDAVGVGGVLGLVGASGLGDDLAGEDAARGLGAGVNADNAAGLV